MEKGSIAVRLIPPTLPYFRILENVMTFQPAPDCAEAVPVMILGGQLVVMVLNFKAVGTYDQTAINRLAEGVDQWMSDSMLPQLSTALDYTATVVRGLSEAVDLTDTVGDAAGTGVVTGGCFPANAAFVITHRSGLTGRSARGRSYVPGIPMAGSPSLNEVNGTRAAALATAFNDLRLDALGRGWVFSVLSRFTLGDPRTSAVAYEITGSFARNLLIDSQRGRLPSNH